MKDKCLQLRDAATHSRLCQIRDSWTLADRRRRAEEGRQRREEFVQMILKGHFGDDLPTAAPILEGKLRPASNRRLMTPSHQPISKDAKRLGA